MRVEIGSLYCSQFVLVSLALASFVTAEPPLSGGYPNSIQSSGYGAPSAGGYGSGGSGGGDGYGSEPANYDFQYEVYGGGNLFGHQESRRDTKTNGKYHVLLPDGRKQIVTYIADETGYHPTITYEDGEGSSGGYGSPGSSSPSGGYGSPGPSSPSGGYGSPSDNSINNQQSGGYSSRSKRQQLTPEDNADLSTFADLVKVYKSENRPNQRYRNRRRRFTPKKTYLVVYPDVPTLRESLRSVQ